MEHSDTNPGESELTAGSPIEHLVAACGLDFECAVKLKELGITKISHLCGISKEELGEELGKELKLSMVQVRFYLCMGYFSNCNVRQSLVVSR